MTRKVLFALVIAESMVIMLGGVAFADPTGPVRAPVFCFRITDIERAPGTGSGGTDFIFEFEVLNWTNANASGVAMASTIGTTALNGTIPTITGIEIDPNGRGGPLGGNDIGNRLNGGKRFDGDGGPPGPLNPALGEIHNGRGSGAFLNDWSPTGSTITTAVWSAGTPIPNKDLIGAVNAGQNPLLLIPGGDPLGLDARGDSAIDGGPGTPGFRSGTGNVLDGFTLAVSNFDPGERLSLNWFLLGATGNPLGTAGGGNAYGFGVINLIQAPVGPPLFKPIFGGTFVNPALGPNTGMTQSPINFFDAVFSVPDPADFAVEFGISMTASYLNPNNVIGVPNAEFVPEPSSLLLLGSGLLGLGWLMRRRQRQ